MVFRVEQLSLILDLFFSPNYPARRALYLIATIAALVPLLQLQRNQRQATRRNQTIGWDATLTSALELLASNDKAADDHPDDDQESARTLRAIRDLRKDLSALSDITEVEKGALISPLPDVLCTPHLNCAVCDTHPALRRRKDAHAVRVLGGDAVRTSGILVSAVCKECKTIYWPDRRSLRPNLASEARLTQLEPDPTFILVSKSDQLWVHRDIALMQESAFRNLHCGWSSFATYLNESKPGGTAMTYRQVRRLFAEHFGRRLLRAHGKIETFRTVSEHTADDLMSAVVTAIGKGGGTGPGAFEHSCSNCTHQKRYRTANQPENAAREDQVVGIDDVAPHDNDAGAAQLPAQLPPDGDQDLQVTMAVMDGKAIQHAICAIKNCDRGLQNYKDGRFCEAHVRAGWNDKCGIIPCGRTRAKDLGTKFYACDLPEHKAFFEAYQRRFARMTFSGVQRVIRQQVRAEEEGAPGLQLRPHLPDINGLAGNRVEHVFRPRAVYCIQTIQWACGFPIAWTKFYDSESVTNVFRFLEHVWADHPLLRPCFIAYDKACAFLAHLQKSEPDSTWIEVTRFIVDTWHYVGHRADDLLCRTFCNPAPADGSQPDLVLERTDDNGRVHRTRAFNLETAEQFNSWLDRYKYLLEQMSATAHDFTMHSLFMLYGEIVESRIAQRAARDAARAARAAEQNSTDEEIEIDEDHADENDSD